VLADVWYTSPQPGELLLKWLGEGDEPATRRQSRGEKHSIQQMGSSKRDLPRCRLKIN